MKGTIEKRRFNNLLVFSAMSFVLLLSSEIKGETCTKQEAEQVCKNWLAYNIYIHGDWAGEKNPYLAGCHEIIESDTLLGYHFTIYPSGYINIPVLKELHPISSYSETYENKEGQKIVASKVTKNSMHNSIRKYLEVYGSIDVVQPCEGDVIFGKQYREKWEKYLKTEKEFSEYLTPALLETKKTFGPQLDDRARDNKPAFLKTSYRCSPNIQNPEFFVEKAYQRLEKRKQFLGTDDPRSYFLPSKVQHRRSYISVRFYQAVKGIRIEKSGLGIHLDLDGNYKATRGVKIYPEAKNIDTTPSISEEQAINIAVNHSESLHPKALPAHAKDVELLIAKIDDKLQLLWFMRVLHGRFFECTYAAIYYINGKTGEVSKIESRFDN